MSPRRGFFFVKKHVPRNLEHVLLGFCHFGSVLGSQEGPFKDFLIFIVGFKSDRIMPGRFRVYFGFVYSKVRIRRNRAKRRVGRVSVLSLHAGWGV